MIRKLITGMCVLLALVMLVLFALSTGDEKIPVGTHTFNQQHFVQDGDSAYAPQAPLDCVHVVSSGETLSGLAPNNWLAVANYNGIANPNLIYVGQRINLCVGGSGGSGAPVATSNYVASSGYGPCQSGQMFANVSSWSVPPGCYSAIYGGYWWSGRADCFSLVQVLHSGRVPYMAYHSYPVLGAVIHFNAGVQGAGSGGHYAQVVAISGSWMLIFEQNMYWRGGGYARSNYRYVYASGGMSYLW